MWWDLVSDLFYCFILVSTDFHFLYFFWFITGLEVKVKTHLGFTRDVSRFDIFFYL